MLKKLAKNQIMIERIVEEDETVRAIKDSGLAVPSFMADKRIKTNRAVVVFVGIGEEIKELGLEVGDVILLSRYSGIEVGFDDKKYLIINITDVLGVLDKV